MPRLDRRRIKHVPELRDPKIPRAQTSGCIRQLSGSRTPRSGGMVRSPPRRCSRTEAPEPPARRGPPPGPRSRDWPPTVSNCARGQRCLSEAHQGRTA
jgi:hypothetical protein